MSKTDTYFQEANSPTEEASFNHKTLHICVKGKKVVTKPPRGSYPVISPPSLDQGWSA